VRSIVTDFELTVLWPLLVAAAALLWLAIRMRLASGRRLREVQQDFQAQMKVNEVRADTVALRNEAGSAYFHSGTLLYGVITALVLLILLLFIGDKWKVLFAYFIWGALWVASVVGFIVSLPMAWHYAKKWDWLKLGLCLLGMLLAAASAEHFFHQRINAKHIYCPHCTDDDDDRPDDN
jgi:hypothetical protein